MDFTTSITDIHTHVLFDLDDGPGTLEESLDLLSTMKAQGVQRIFCTSHYRSPHFSVEWSEIQSRFAELSESIAALPGSYPGVTIGAEVRISEELTEDIRTETVPTLGNSSYVLIELPGHDIPESAVDTIYELQVRGYRPILAHPERNMAVQRDLDWIDKLVDMGLYLQLTADCLKRKPGRQHMADTVAWHILKQGKAALIASDAHNTTSRPPTLADAYEYIGQQVGHETVGELKRNADAIWAGDKIAPVAAASVGRSWSLPFFKLRR